VKPNDKYENMLLALLEQHAGVTEPWSYPLGAVLDASSVCHLKCLFCVNSLSPPVRTRTMMQMDLFRKLIDEIGPYLFKVWLYNWGEPLTHTGIVDMLKLLKQYLVDEVEIGSNLSTRIPDATIYGLVEEGLDILTASIDGITQQSYSRYRVRGDLSLALSNMERFVKAKRDLGRTTPKINWQFLVFSHNETELEEARKHAEDLGVDFRPIAPYIDIANYPDWISSIDEYVMDKYKNKAPSGGPLPEQPIHQTVQDRLNALSNVYYKGCDWHYLLTAINANGSVSPCCAIWKESDDFGSLDGKMFAEVWNNEMFRAARKHLKYQSSEGGSGNVCMNCYSPEIMDYAQYIVRSALVNAPEKVKTRIKRLIPTNPLVKELSIEETINLFQTTEAIESYPLHGSDGQESELLEKARQINAPEAPLKEAMTVLERIHNSRGWKALLFYYKLRDRVLPKGSRRRVFVKKVLRIVCGI
jgi:MoaA/NifB/PqqE/SkfB family radical SAM enzyme